MAGEKEKLSEGKVDKISGGWIVVTKPPDYESSAPRYCVVNSEGKAYGWFRTKEEAQDYANQHGISSQEISWDQLTQKLMARRSPPLNKRTRISDN